jgi:hypothetical protein
MNAIVEEIVKKFLTDNEFDGLFNVDGECACLTGHLAPCGNISGMCEAGYLKSATNSRGDDWRILRHKSPKVRRCCFVGCTKNAEYEILDHKEERYDMGTTDACEEHVGELIGSFPPTKPNGPWTITVIHNDQEKPITEDAVKEGK